MTNILDRMMSAEQLRSIRTSLGMTQRELAYAIGWASGSGGRHIRRFEKGDQSIPPHIADKIRNLCQEEAQR